MSDKPKEEMSRNAEIIEIMKNHEAFHCEGINNILSVSSDDYKTVATEIEALFKRDNSEKRAEGLPNTEKWLNRNCQPTKS